MDFINLLRGSSGKPADVDDNLSDDSYTSAQSAVDPSGEPNKVALLLQLPPEIIDEIFSYLEYRQLVSLMRTCHSLRVFAEKDLLWLKLLQEHIPLHDFPIDGPDPSPTYRHLFMTHHPYWFLPRNRIWISDDPHVGKLILCKFDRRRGCIEGYRLLAERGPTIGMHWAYKPSVLIHTFTPRLHLWLDDPVLKLPHSISPFNHGKQGWWKGEIEMNVGRRGHSLSASFFLAKDIPRHYQAASMELWPPRTIPDMPRVRAASQNKFRGEEHKPQDYDEISQTAFRMRQWSQFFAGNAHYGVRLGEEVTTWSTLDPKLYTPTSQKPYQGIFVGDYAGHGCEFLLVLQTERAPPPPRHAEPSGQLNAILQALENESDDSDDPEINQFNMKYGSQSVTANLEDDVAHSGSLEAIKLTGDPNVPRGEHTFIADDLGPRGFIRIATEPPFRGARVVKSRGHVAARGFQHDEFVPSQLIMISPNRLAQYWRPYGHVSFYERVDIDGLLGDTRYRRASDGGFSSPSSSNVGGGS